MMAVEELAPLLPPLHTRLYPRRWYILGVFATLAMIQVMRKGYTVTSHNNELGIQIVCEQLQKDRKTDRKTNVNIMPQRLNANGMSKGRTDRQEDRQSGRQTDKATDKKRELHRGRQHDSMAE